MVRIPQKHVQHAKESLLQKHIQHSKELVPQKYIQHSKELVLRNRVAEQNETISLLMNALDLLLEQYVKHQNKFGSFRSNLMS